MPPSEQEDPPVVEQIDFYLKYEPREILGDGISSVVRRCVCKETGKEYAVKVIDKFCKRGENVKGIDVITQVHTEVSALSKLRGHPNIITLKNFYESSVFMFLVFELAKGGELFDYLTKEVTVPEKTARTFMWQLLQAVKHMHTQDVVHRDLKPENILLDENDNILLSDFGFAFDTSNGREIHDVAGTPAYFAPEILKRVVNDCAPGYGKPVDLWACGVILFTLLVGQGPFWHRKDTIMYRKIMAGQYEFRSPEWDDISEGPKDFIRKLLIVDPKERLTSQEALSHPWFEGIVACQKCSILQDVYPQKVKPKLKFKILVYTVMTMKQLFYTYHERHVPMTYKAVLAEPYGFKDVRKIVDSCAFTMYGHWVKRTPDQVQNRAALFATTPKREIVSLDQVDGKSLKIPLMYSYELTHTFIPKRPSFVPRNSETECDRILKKSALVCTG